LDWPGASVLQPRHGAPAEAEAEAVGYVRWFGEDVAEMVRRLVRRLLRPFVCAQCVNVCEGCGCCAIDELYMLRDAVWDSAAFADEMLCVGCFERRLGRRLVPDDFYPDVPINYDRMSERLEARKGDRFRVEAA
jgi:hypothetical protein